MSNDFMDEISPLLSALAIEILKIIIGLFLTGKISADSIPGADVLGIHDKASAEGFLRKINKNIKV
jgi:hypothetical protein